MKKLTSKIEKINLLKNYKKSKKIKSTKN